MQRTFFVGNLPYQTDEPMIRELFSPYGSVLSVHLVGDRVSGVFRRFGFLKIETADPGRIIDTLDKMPLGQQFLIVQELNPRDVTQPV